MAYQWVAAGLLSQQVIADLPGVEPQWPLRRTISAADTATATLHLDAKTPGDWEGAVYEGGTVLACYDAADPASPIVWAGYVVEQTRDAVSDEVPLSLATFEAVLDRAFVGDVTYSPAWRLHDIIHNLAVKFTAATGIPLPERYVPGTGKTPTEPIVMQNTDNATVKARLDQVCGQLGGEYTVDWQWINSGQGVQPVLVHADRIGQAAPSGGRPLVTFELPGQLTSVTQSRSYAADKAGNKIVAYSSGLGTAVPYAAPVYAAPDGRPALEYRYQPAPSVPLPALAQYAARAVPILGPGARPVTLTASTVRADARRLGVDWRLGDDIGYHVPASYTNEQGVTVQVRAFPNGLDGVGRAVAYELDGQAGTVTPILADKTVYVAA